MAKCIEVIAVNVCYCLKIVNFRFQIQNLMEQRGGNVWFGHAVLNYGYINQNDEIIKKLHDSEYYHMMDYDYNHNPYETKIISCKRKITGNIFIRSKKNYF